MFSNAWLSKEFWVEAVNLVCYLVNRSSSIPNKCRTLEEAWSGSPSNYVSLRIYGCLLMLT